MLLLEDKLTKVIDTIDRLALIPTEFGANIEEDWCPVAEELGWRIEKETGISIEVYHGVSKMAIIIPGCSLVIKIPFNGQWRYEERYNEETKEYEKGEECFEPFYEYEDYCALEESVYQNAEAAGFEQYLAKTSFYKTIKNCYVYVQEKVFGMYSDKATTPTDDSRKKIKDRCGDYLGTSDWSACFIDFFGEDAFEKFYNYCVYGDDEHDMCIADDLHSGNIGFRADGSPVILDYSGWACE